MKEAFAVAASAIAILSVTPYIIDTIKGKTRPNIVSWFTWSLLTGIAMAAAFAAHEPRTALLLLGETIGTFLVGALGLKYGYAKLSLFDGLCQIGAIAGLIFWLVFNSPTIATVSMIGIDIFAALPTFRHSWTEPQEETWQTYALGVLATVLTVASLTHYSINSAVFPVYLLLGNGGLMVTVIYRRVRKGMTLAR
jgi:hypothetical protein